MGDFLEVRQFAIFSATLQVIFIILFAVFADYSLMAYPADTAAYTSKANDSNADTSRLDHYYPMFQDVHVMIFVGFGFLMTFLKRYGYSSVGINFILASFVIQWSMLVRGFFQLHNGTFSVGIHQMLTADFSAAAALISMGALLGKLSPIQYLIMALFEVVFQFVSEYIVVEKLEANDVGGSMIIHVFGAYFGLTVSRIIWKKHMIDHEFESFVYHSDLFAMIGTLFLWIFWPSFNAAVAEPADARHRAVVNTYLCLTACCLVSFVISSLTHSRGRFTMDHVLNGSLAGGVAIGATANLILHPFGALIIGAGAAVLSVIGFKYIQPYMSQTLRIHDTCGVHNLHGMPGVFAGVFGVIAAAFVTVEEYGKADLEKIYPAILSKKRTADEQCFFQLAALCICLGISIVGGIITGFILRLPGLNKVNETNYYSDNDFWVMPEDFDFVTDTDFQKKIWRDIPLVMRVEKNGDKQPTPI